MPATSKLLVTTINGHKIFLEGSVCRDYSRIYKLGELHGKDCP